MKRFIEKQADGDDDRRRQRGTSSDGQLKCNNTNTTKGKKLTTCELKTNEKWDNSPTHGAVLEVLRECPNYCAEITAVETSPHT